MVYAYLPKPYLLIEFYFSKSRAKVFLTLLWNGRIDRALKFFQRWSQNNYYLNKNRGPTEAIRCPLGRPMSSSGHTANKMMTINFLHPLFDVITNDATNLSVTITLSFLHSVVNHCVLHKLSDSTPNFPDIPFCQPFDIFKLI